MNQIMSVAQIKDDVKFGPSGAYLFFGEEEYMKHYYLTEFRKKLVPDEDMSVFSHKKLDCSELDFEKITDALQTTSMGFFADGKILCELHEIPFSALKESEWNQLFEAISQASEDVVAVIYVNDGELDVGVLPKSPSKTLQRLMEVCKPVYFAREGELKLSKWVAKHFINERLSFENGVCEQIVAYCGRDMFVLSNEISKTVAFVKESGESMVKLEHVKKICSRNLEINAFDFSNALLNQQTDNALEILADMKLRKEKPTYVLGSVLKVITELYSVKTLLECGYNEFEISKELKIHEYKVGLYKKSCERRPLARLKRLLESCTETDIKMKSISVDDYTELDKLVILATSK